MAILNLQCCQNILGIKSGPAESLMFSEVKDSKTSDKEKKHDDKGKLIFWVDVVYELGMCNWS